MIRLYTKITPCEKCNRARSELIRRGLPFSEHTDIKPILKRILAAGINEFPIVDNGVKLRAGQEAIDWIRLHGVQ